jgi:hypothetical protein
MLRRTGLSGRKRPVAPSLLSEFETMVKEVQSGLLVRPAAVTRVLKILEITTDQVVIAGGVALPGNVFYRKARNATHIGLAICTIGKDLEEMASKCRQDDLLRGLILDGIGSAAVDSLVADVGRRFCLVAAQMNLTAGSMLFFGMAGLPIKDLESIFEPLPAWNIGVRLTSGYIMFPQKTCAFVVGIGPAMQTCSKQDACRQCALHKICRYGV